MEMESLEHILMALAGILASSGFWMYIIKKDTMKSASNKMLLGLGHDRIVYLGTKYLERGSITQDEYENLYDYLYLPYLEMGGNGGAKKIMDDVAKLQIKNIKQ